MIGPFSYTVLKTEVGYSLAKRIIRQSGGELTIIPYDRPTFFTMIQRQMPSLAAWRDELAELATKPRCCIVMGAPIIGINLNRRQRRRWAVKRDRPVTMCAVGRNWLPLDIDTASVPAGLGQGERVIEAARYIRDQVLPQEFHNITCLATPTARSGLLGAEIANLRLFFALRSLIPLERLRDWTLGAQTCGLPIDPAVVQTAQPIYTSRPRFAYMSDPVPASLHAVLLSGSAGDVVHLDLDRYASQTADIRVRVRSAEQRARAGSIETGWKEFLKQTVGGPGSFFLPLSRGLGLAARSPASREEIIAFVRALMAEYAAYDPGRRARYNDAWVASTVDSFRRSDQHIEDRIKRLRARLYAS